MERRRRRRGGGFLGDRQAKFHAMLRIQGQQGTVRVYTVEQGGRKRGGRSGKREQKQQQTDSEGKKIETRGIAGQTALLLWGEGGSL